MRLAGSDGARAWLTRLLPLLLVPLALAAYLLWPRGNAQAASKCIDSQIKLPSGVQAVDFGCGKLTLSDAAKSVTIRVEVAEGSDQTERGLMYRPQMDPEAGMVFLFDSPSRGGFWMMNTLIPLSIAFFDERGVINDILDMEPCRSPVNCPSYYPKHDYVGAIEVNKGFFAKHGIRTGASASLQRDQNTQKK